MKIVLRRDGWTVFKTTNMMAHTCYVVVNDNYIVSTAREACDILGVQLTDELIDKMVID